MKKKNQRSWKQKKIAEMGQNKYKKINIYLCAIKFK